MAKADPLEEGRLWFLVLLSSRVTLKLCYTFSFPFSVSFKIVLFLNTVFIGLLFYCLGFCFVSQDFSMQIC